MKEAPEFQWVSAVNAHCSLVVKGHDALLEISRLNIFPFHGEIALQGIGEVGGKSTGKTVNNEVDVGDSRFTPASGPFKSLEEIDLCRIEELLGLELAVAHKVR